MSDSATSSASGAAWRAALLGISLLAAAGVAAAEPPRFFFSGDGVLRLAHGHFNERIEARYRDRDGKYDPEALARLRRFFRSRDNGEEGDVSLRLVELIDYVEDRYHPSQVVLLSGYRSPNLNEQLRANGARAAKSSLHSEGIAADLALRGLDLRKLWIDLREKQAGGVGYYRKEGFLHLDTGRPRFWEPQTSRVEEDLSRGNARLFARTDFDRYATLEGAVITLHSLTLLPTYIAREAHLGGATLELEPVAAGVDSVDGCYRISEPARAYRFRVARVASDPGQRRSAIRLKTCPPRREATPEDFETNPVEVAAARAR